MMVLQVGHNRVFLVFYLVFDFLRIVARYTMKKRALAASPCGEPINDLKSSPSSFSSFTAISTLSSKRCIRHSSSGLSICFKSSNRYPLCNVSKAFDISSISRLISHSLL